MAVSATKQERASHLRWVPIAEMRVSPKTQRKFQRSHAEKIAADFDLEALGFPVVSMREGHYWIVDGQHRIEALKIIGYGDQQVQCECYEGLTEPDEAELFLRRDDRRKIRPFDRLRLGIEAGREVECDIQRISLALGVKLAQDGDENSVGAPGAVYEVYQHGPAVYSRTLRIVRDGFAGDGKKFQSEIIRGVGLVCQRYNGALSDEIAIQRLGSLKGASELMRRAGAWKAKTGRTVPECVAAAVVDVVNGGARGVKKLPSWWS